MAVIYTDASHSGGAVLIRHESFDATDVKAPIRHGRRAFVMYSSRTNSVDALTGNPIAQTPATAPMPVICPALDKVRQSKQPGRSAVPTASVILCG